MGINYTVIKIPQPGRIWALPHSLLKKYALKINDSVTLKCGATTVSDKISVFPEKNNSRQIGLSAEVLTALGIPGSVSFQIKPLGKGVFQLGPVIGILTFPGHIPNRLGYYNNYLRGNNNGGLVYVFRGRDIKPDRQRIHGYYYDPVQKKWQHGEFPYPDAVIDRCYPNPYISHHLLEQVIGPGRIFNKKSMIDKLDFYKALVTNHTLAKHIPETALFKESSQLIYFLETYEEVFFKPVNAMMGFGIVVVRKKDRHTLECSYTVKGKQYCREISSPKEIFNVLIAAAGRRRPYVIQQGIPRMEYRGGPFSIRSWAMKNGQGKWVIPGMFAKGTFGQGFLTNFCAGAKLIPLEKLFADIVPRLPYTRNELVNLVESLTLQTAAALDAKYGPLGELGMDIIFDTAGKPWLIEANGNPGNAPIFIQKEYPLWRHLIFVYPMEYAAYLAGFKGQTQI